MATAELPDLLEVAESNLRRRCATKHDLRVAWGRRFGIWLPRVAVCPGHIAPLDAVWQAYSGQDRSVIWLANRGGGKTLNLGYREAMECDLLGIEVGHVSATLAQADRMQGYASHYVAQRPHALAGPRGEVKQKIRFGSGGKLEILAGTMSGVNGPHPIKASLDEIDLMPAPVIQQAHSMPQSRGEYLAAMRLASTRKFAAGNMQKAIDGGRWPVRAWCLFETMARCTEATCSRCERAVSHDRTGKPHTFAAVCGGKARRSDGWIRLDDALQAFGVLLDLETFRAEWLCEKPESVGQYYQHFSWQVHCINEADTEWRPEHGRGILVGLDFGVSDPNAAVIGIAAGTRTRPWGKIVWVDSLIDGDGDTIAQTWPRIWRLVQSYRERLPREYQGADHIEWWGDPDGRSRQHGAASPLLQIRNLSAGSVRVRTSKKLNRFEPRHDAVENRLRVRSDGEPQCYVLLATKGARDLATDLQALRRPLDRDGQPTGEGFVHDQHSHRCTALEFATVGLDTIVLRGQGDLEDAEVKA